MILNFTTLLFLHFSHSFSSFRFSFFFLLIQEIKTINKHLNHFFLFWFAICDFGFWLMNLSSRSSLEYLLFGGCVSCSCSWIGASFQKRRGEAYLKSIEFLLFFSRDGAGFLVKNIIRKIGLEFLRKLEKIPGDQKFWPLVLDDPLIVLDDPPPP